MAKAVEHALTAAKPQTRYLIGRRAKIQAKLAAVLPDRAMDRIVEREINRTRPAGAG